MCFMAYDSTAEYYNYKSWKIPREGQWSHVPIFFTLHYEQFWVLLELDIIVYYDYILYYSPDFDTTKS